MPVVILALGRLRQGHCEFWASMDYKARLCPPKQADKKSRQMASGKKALTQKEWPKMKSFLGVGTPQLGSVG